MTTAPDLAARERDLNSLYVVTVIVILVIATATFGSVIAAFIWRSQNGYLWQHLQIPSLLWLTTAILAVSSYLFERGRSFMKNGDQPDFVRMMRWATVLGTAFLLGQAAAWMQVVKSVSLSQDKHAWFVFLFSALHALHIIAGLAGLGYLLHRANAHASGPRYQMTTRAYTNALAIFWHYLGVVWVILFALLLIWKR